MTTPLDIDADLELMLDDETIRVTGAGDRVRVTLPSARAGRSLLRVLPGAPDRSTTVQGLDQSLRAAGVTAEVTLDEATVARLGADAQPGAWSRLLRLGDVEVHPMRLASARKGTLAALAAGLASLLAALYFWRRDS